MATCCVGVWVGGGLVCVAMAVSAWEYVYSMEGFRGNGVGGIVALWYWLLGICGVVAF